MKQTTGSIIVFMAGLMTKWVKFDDFSRKLVDDKFGKRFVLFLSQNLGGNGRDTSTDKIGESFALFYSFKRILGTIDS